MMELEFIAVVVSDGGRCCMVYDRLGPPKDSYGSYFRIHYYVERHLRHERRKKHRVILIIVDIIVHIGQ